MLRCVGLRAGEAGWRYHVAASGGTSLELARASARVSAGRCVLPPSSSSRHVARQYSGLARWTTSTPARRDTEISRHVFDTLARARASSQPSAQQLATTAWRRHAHTRSKRRRQSAATGLEMVRHKSTNTAKDPPQPSNTTAPKAELSPDNKAPPPITPPPKQEQPQPQPQPHPQPQPQPQPPQEEHYSILNHLPHLPTLHRPTKDELLAAATSAWSRFKIHFKWFSIRSFRPWNADDVSAFITWFVAGHVIWILVGTTTFFSLIIFLINTAFTQETLARWVGDYLTQSSGIQVVFESAVVPKWGDGVISFHNVFVSRRPGQGKSTVKKGSQAEAAAAAAASSPSAPSAVEEDDGNYTQFDVSMDTVNVTLSFAKWFNGKGLLRSVEIRGIRGVIDRTHVNASAWEGIDPRSWKHEHQTGDFELEAFKMEDMLVTVYQPDGMRPFTVSVHLCELPRLRKQWLFYDFLSANVVSGAYDNAMFAIHPSQTPSLHPTQHAADIPWKKHARFRIDGLNIEHLNRGAEGMFAWIKEGKVDIVSDMMFPSDEEGIAKVMSDFYDRVEGVVTSSAREANVALREGGFGSIALMNGAETKREEREEDDTKNRKSTSATTAAKESLNPSSQSQSQPQSRPHSQETDNDDSRFLLMDIRVQLSDVRATVPFFTHDVSYINNALIRPIVAYINSRRAFIPVQCRVVKKLADFDGSWTVHDSGLMDDLGREVYEAFARDVLDDDQLRRRRFKKVGVWTLQLAAQALFIGLAGNIA